MRARILSIIAENEPISITKLSKLAGISTGTTTYRYVQELKDRKLIILKKENKKRGKPTMLSITNKANPLNIKAIESMNKVSKIWEKLKGK